MWTKKQLDSPWEIMYFDGETELVSDRRAANSQLRQRLDQWMESGDTVVFWTTKWNHKPAVLAEVRDSTGEPCDASAILLPAKRMGSHLDELAKIQ